MRQPIATMIRKRRASVTRPGPCIRRFAGATLAALLAVVMHASRAGTPWLEAPSHGRPALSAMFVQVAAAHGLDVRLLHAVAHVESRHDPLAVSPKGARGLLQVMPGTAVRFGVLDPAVLADPLVNLHVGAAYLARLLGMFDGDLSLALAAYNAGEGAVVAAGYRIPPYKETQIYVRKVVDTLARLQTERYIDPLHGSGAAAPALAAGTEHCASAPRTTEGGHRSGAGLATVREVAATIGDTRASLDERSRRLTHAGGLRISAVRLDDAAAAPAPRPPRDRSDTRIHRAESIPLQTYRRIVVPAGETREDDPSLSMLLSPEGPAQPRVIGVRITRSARTGGGVLHTVCIDSLDRGAFDIQVPLAPDEALVIERASDLPSAGALWLIPLSLDPDEASR